MLSNDQIRAARALLGWSQTDLADRASLSQAGIARIETGENTPNSKTLEKIHAAFEQGGIEFLENDGLRRKRTDVQILSGVEGLRKFMDDVYNIASQQGGLICVYNAKPENWRKWLGDDWLHFHLKRMEEINPKPDFRITVRQGDTNLLGRSHAVYRYIPDSLWDERTFYAYGDRLGFINFQDHRVDVFVLHEKHFADSFRSMFLIIWERISSATSQTV